MVPRGVKIPTLFTFWRWEMNVMRKSFTFLLVGALLCLGGTTAFGSVYLADSFLTGSNSASGEYSVSDLNGQAPAVGPFSGAWAGATDFAVVETGLTYPGLYGAGGGAVQFASSTNSSGSILRNFTGLEPV